MKTERKIQIINSDNCIITYSQSKIKYIFINTDNKLSIKTIQLPSQLNSNHIKRLFTCKDDYNGSEILVILTEKKDFFMLRMKKSDFSLKFLCSFDLFWGNDRSCLFISSINDGYYKVMLIEENVYKESVISRKKYDVETKSYEYLRGREFNIEYIEESRKDEEVIYILVKDKQSMMLTLLVFSHIIKSVVSSIEVSSLFKVLDCKETKEKKLDFLKNHELPFFLFFFNRERNDKSTIFFLVYEFKLLNTNKQDIIVIIDLSNTDYIHIILYFTLFFFKNEYFLVKEREELEPSQLNVFKNKDIDKKKDFLLLTVNYHDCVFVYNINIKHEFHEFSNLTCQSPFKIHVFLLKKLVFSSSFSSISEFFVSFASVNEKKLGLLKEIYVKRLYNEKEYGKSLLKMLFFLKRKTTRKNSKSIKRFDLKKRND